MLQVKPFQKLRWRGRLFAVPTDFVDGANIGIEFGREPVPRRNLSPCYRRERHTNAADFTKSVAANPKSLENLCQEDAAPLWYIKAAEELAAEADASAKFHTLRE